MSGKRTKRTDEHRAGAIIPADYAYVLGYSTSNSMGPSVGVNCELARFNRTARGVEVVRGQHNPAGGCCIVQLHQDGAKFSEFGATGKCSVCGAAFGYGEVWKHEGTGEHIHLGWECADKYGMLSGDRATMVAYREQQARERKLTREKGKGAAKRQQVLDANPGLEAALATDHRIVRDIAARFGLYNSLSPAQVALVLKLAGEAAQKAANPAPAEQHVPAPTGRVEFTGQVVSIKSQPGYGYNSPDVTKLVVKVQEPAGCWLAWVTCPAGLDAQRGATVAMTATLERGRDAHFAFGKRPTGARLVQAAAC